MTKPVARVDLAMADDTIAGRIRALREAIGLLTGGLSQEKAAEIGGILRTEWWKVESGLNKLSSARMRHAIAKGLGITPATLREYLAGTIDVAIVLRRRSGLTPEPESLAQTVGRFQGRWTLEDIAAVEARYGEEVPAAGWAAELDRQKALREGDPPVRHIRSEQKKKRLDSGRAVGISGDEDEDDEDDEEESAKSETRMACKAEREPTSRTLSA